MTERRIRHDGFVASPCLHSRHKPVHIHDDETGQHRLECPDSECGVQTGAYPSLALAKIEWEAINQEEFL
jgi:hypothetical protein